MADYDIKKAFRRIELELIESMIHNLKRHRAEEDEKGFKWSQWQVEQLAALELYKKRNSKKYGTVFADINSRIESLIKIQRDAGSAEQEIAILEALKQGAKLRKSKDVLTTDFFQINDRKLEALIKATLADMEKAEVAILRMANDKYRKIIFDAQMYANSGAGTYEKAVDMATKDFLEAGINCIEYKNGARHTLSDYADMALRTAGKRAYLQGEGEMRQQWGLSLVILNKRGNPCPKCLPFCGKVLVDDVWSGGKSEDGNYPLMSYAIEQGLYHPRCKDSHTTYFKGISTAEDTWTEEELKNIGLNAKNEARLQYAERQKEKYERLEKNSLDSDNRKKYKQKVTTWNLEKNKISDTLVQENTPDKRKQINRPYIDLTEELLANTTWNNFDIQEMTEVVIDGITYAIDGVNIKQNNSENEIKVGQLLSDIFKKKVELVPEIKGKYKNVSTPDYLIDGEKWDLKELRGESKDAIRNAISKKKKQANNFVIDIAEYKLGEAEALKQAELVFSASNTKFVNTLIIINNKEIIKILKRI